MQCDISDAASIAAFADTFSAEVGALDVLVNNAAIAFKVRIDAVRGDRPDTADELQGRSR